MSEQNKQVIQRWFDEVWNNAQENAIDEMFHPEGKAHGLAAEAIIGSDGFKPFYRSFMDTFADIHIKVDRLFADGDYVTTLCTVNAIYRKENKPVNFSGATITRIENGQIVEGWNHFDFLAMYMQMGKIKPEQLS